MWMLLKPRRKPSQRGFVTPWIPGRKKTFPPPRMINRTSEAIKNMTKECEVSLFNPETKEHLIHESVSMRFYEWTAVAAKYQKMEEALLSIVGKDETSLPSSVPVQVAKEAIDFDLLSSNQ